MQFNALAISMSLARSLQLDERRQSTTQSKPVAASLSITGAMSWPAIISAWSISFCLNRIIRTKLKLKIKGGK